MAHTFTNALNKLLAVTAFALSISVSSSHAQQERRDSIKAATVYGDRIREEAGSRLVKPADFLNMTCVTGSADVIKFVQTLPGVSTGAEGSSAFYVRGGNLGSNIITLDGVPIYGSSHLLGFSSVYSADMVSDVLFQVGGFTSNEGNLTSSHISVNSLDGDMGMPSAKLSASNFLIGAKVSTPIIKDKLSLVATARISPIGAELRAVKGLSNAMDSISAIKAAVYDVFGKIKWNINQRNNASLSVFNSLDSYGYRYGETSDDRMRWSNLIVNLSHNFSINQRSGLQSSVSYNHFSSRQGMRKVLGETDNNLAMQNPIREWILQSTYSNTVREGISLQGGIKARNGKFAPGTSCVYSKNLVRSTPLRKIKDATSSWLAVAHAQAEFSKPHKYLLRAAGRLNYYTSHCPVVPTDDRSFFNPEASLLARINISRSFGLETTADWTVQYYHTLEGIPLGWSLDMIVPSNASCAPEKAAQYYAGFFFESREHHLKSGGYYKDMRNLTYFADAVQLFTAAATAWRNNIETGSGRSYGMEVLYDVTTDRFNGRIAYTLSKTDRLFAGLNKGRRFPAKFDRRHILNANAEYTISRKESKEFGLSTFFTYQSGHRANVPAWEYTGELLPNGEDKVVVKYYAGENALQLPPYIRWDVGCFIRHGIGTSHPWTLNIGIYNVLNRHNAYNVFYDTGKRKWRQISLFPIMPSLSWTMEF
jgi:hypothetical protein